MMDTIFSLASARGKAGVSVIRISGPHSLIATKKISGNLPQFRTAGLRKIIASDGRFLDEALVLCFEEGASFTGECVVELQLHGSTAVVKAVLEELSTHDGLRMAEPGEFTRRALENERLDLTQVEGLADLLEAETEAQRRQALTVLSGKLGEIAGKWRKSLIRAAALLEATIDFADEDVPYDVSPEVNELLSNVLITLNKEVDSVKISERIRDGFVIAILGEPNIGKSTLLNALAGRDVAITSEIAGTTRDVIEVQMDLAGLPVTILDTAGLRETTDIVEELGVRKGIDRAKAADLRVFLKSSDDTEFMLTPEIDDIIAYGKGDMVAPSVFSVSGLTGKGIDQLIDIISKKLGDRVKGAGVATRERHRVEMVNALDAIIYAQEEVSYGPERAEFAAEQMRVAIRSLDSLVGRIDVEHLLDEIFSSFCLGK